MITIALCPPAGGRVVVVLLVVGVGLVGVGLVGVGLGGQVLCFARQVLLFSCAARVEVTDAALVETP
jgi:hypothetical protein